MHIMKNGTRTLVIGNWKMNPMTGALAQKLVKDLKKSLAKIMNVDVVIAPPMLYIENSAKVLGKDARIKLGVQNIHHEKLGAHTGEVSIPMVKPLGVAYVILGHSERRAAGETDEQVHTKLLAVIKNGLTPVVCVGEKERDANGQYLALIEAQIKSALKDVPKSKLGNVVIAYEPIWAIGTGVTATPADVHEMSLFIEKVLSDMYGRTAAQKVRLLYGGSVNEKNARDLFVEGTVHGFLVGGASLNAESFTSIVKQTIA